MLSGYGLRQARLVMIACELAAQGDVDAAVPPTEEGSYSGSSGAAAPINVSSDQCRMCPSASVTITVDSQRSRRRAPTVHNVPSIVRCVPSQGREESALVSVAVQLRL